MTLYSEINEQPERIKSLLSSQRRIVAGQVYKKDFSDITCDVDEVPALYESGNLLGRNIQGPRIGFDLGASARKVSAIVDRTPIYSEKDVCKLRKHEAPEYQNREIMSPQPINELFQKR